MSEKHPFLTPEQFQALDEWRQQAEQNLKERLSPDEIVDALGDNEAIAEQFAAAGGVPGFEGMSPQQQIELAIETLDSRDISEITGYQADPSEKAEIKIEQELPDWFNAVNVGLKAPTEAVAELSHTHQAPDITENQADIADRDAGVEQSAADDALDTLAGWGEL